MLRERIAELCKENKINISNLENSLGLAKSTISKWDKSSPKVENVKKIANYFGVSVDYLLGSNDNPKGTPASQESANLANETKTKELTDLFNKLSTEQQHSVLTIVKGMAGVK